MPKLTYSGDPAEYVFQGRTVTVADGDKVDLTTAEAASIKGRPEWVKPAPRKRKSTSKSK